MSKHNKTAVACACENGRNSDGETATPTPTQRRPLAPTVTGTAVLLSRDCRETVRPKLTQAHTGSPVHRRVFSSFHPPHVCGQTQPRPQFSPSPIGPPAVPTWDPCPLINGPVPFPAFSFAFCAIVAAKSRTSLHVGRT